MSNVIRTNRTPGQEVQAHCDRCDKDVDRVVRTIDEFYICAGCLDEMLSVFSLTIVNKNGFGLNGTCPRCTSITSVGHKETCPLTSDNAVQTGATS